jgi:hypothetical protein
MSLYGRASTISHKISTMRTKFFMNILIKAIAIVDAVDLVDAVAPVVDPVKPL